MQVKLLLVIVACTAAGCREGSAPASPPPAAEVAASMDTRTPVPLLPMMATHQKEQMRGHLSAVQEIIAALGKKDYRAIEEATKRIGYSEPMAQMCNHMGAGAPGFTPAAINFHKTADTIGEAAKKKDSGAVLVALNATLGTCVSCHATYKQQVVDQATWTKLTSTPPPMGH